MYSKLHYLKKSHVRASFSPTVAHQTLIKHALTWTRSVYLVNVQKMARNTAIYRKIPKISPGAYIFQRPFLGGLFLEGLIFGGAYVRREFCVSKSIGLALYWEGNLPFLLCLTLYLRAISKYKPPGAYIWRGDLTEGFLRYEFGGLIHGGAYFRNFTVGLLSVSKRIPYRLVVWR